MMLNYWTDHYVWTRLGNRLKQISQTNLLINFKIKTHVNQVEYIYIYIYIYILKQKNLSV